VSIGKRLIDLARAELNSLLERAAREDDDDDDDRRNRNWDGDPSKLSDSRARGGDRTPPPGATGGRRRGARAANAAAAAIGHAAIVGAAAAARTAATDEALRKAYAALEVPPGSDFEAVRKAYRRLMRKYHPICTPARPKNTALRPT
jgi:DnaJ-domain-containing protein 1